MSPSDKRLEGDKRSASVLAAAVADRGEHAFGDLFREELRSTGVCIEDGEIESAGESIDDGVGLRIYDHGRTRAAWLTRPEPDALAELAASLAGSSKSYPVDFTEVPERADMPGGYGPLTLADKAALCRKLDHVARSVSPKVIQARVNYRDHLRVVTLVRTDGQIVRQLQQGAFISVLVTAAGGGLIQTGYEAIGTSGGWDTLDLEGASEGAALAARRAVTMLDARRAPGGAMPVVLSSSAGGTMVHEAVGHGLEGDLAGEGHSIYKGREGEAVASPLITVIDDPTLPGKRGSYRYDDEGVAASPTVLVDKGVLTGWMHSRESALKMGGQPSGNGRRESYRAPPIPRMSNTVIAPGNDDPSKILADTPEGLFVTRMGGGQVDTVSGDFVFEVAEGFLIEGGKKGEPVRGATLVGNGPAVLREIDRVGTDLGFGIGTCGKDGQGAPVSDAQPTLRIPRLTVGGLSES